MPPRKWHETGFRPIEWPKRFLVERVRARATQELKLKRRFRTRARVAAGEEVWVGKRRHFGWSADVETLDGRAAGRARFKGRFDFSQPETLATLRPAGAGSLVGGLGAAAGN